MAEYARVFDSGNVRLAKSVGSVEVSGVSDSGTGSNQANGTDWTSFHKDVTEIFEMAQLVLEKKHRDYGPKNIADAPGGALNGLRVRVHDKLSRINHLTEHGGAAQYESLEDSWLDMLNYSAIALLVLRGKWQ